MPARSRTSWNERWRHIALAMGAVVCALQLMTHELRAEPGVSWAGWNLDTQGDIVLRDGWTVFRGQLLEPQRFVGRSCAEMAKIVPSETTSVPDLWGPALTTDVTSGHGLATYCIDIELPKTRSLLALKLGTMRSIYSVYTLGRAGDGSERVKHVRWNGDPARMPYDEATSPVVPPVELSPDVSRFKLVIQIANHVHKQGGMIGVPVIQYLDHVDARERRTSAFSSSLFLLLLLVSIGALVIGRVYDRHSGYFIFSALAAASAFRVFLVGNLVWDYFPNLTEANELTLEYLSLFLIVPVYYAFIASLFHRGTIRKRDMAIYGSSALFVAFALYAAFFMRPGAVTLAREPFQLVAVVAGLTMAWQVGRSFLCDPDQKSDALIVMIAALLTIAYEIVTNFNVVDLSMEWSEVLILCLTILHARAFVANSRRVQRERDQLVLNLSRANETLGTKAVELAETAMRAEEASRAKSEFLATMSHELRTPLNAIIGFSEMMKQNMFGPMGNERYAQYVADINESGTHLLSIVNDILDLSRVESGKDDLHEERVDLLRVANLILGLVAEKAAQGGVVCELDVAKDLPDILADERKVKQILINLVGNAIKFNIAGGRVTVSLSGDMSGVAIEVVDTGIGMRPEDIPKALDRFGQVDGNLNRRYEGLGIGLSIVQALVRQHGGALTIVSELGVGTRAIVRFPAERCLASLTTSEQAAVPASSVAVRTGSHP